MPLALPAPDAAARALSDLPRGDGAIRLHREGGLAELLLDHERRRNAVSVGMMLDLRAAVAALEADPPAAVLVHGAGDRAFCAGGDLRAVRAHLLAREAAAAMVAVMTDALDRLAALPALVFAAVDGPALGGGAELLTACDHVTASARGAVGFVQARLGVSPGWGGARRLVARVGPRRAALLLGESRTLSAEQAWREGLVDVLVEQGPALPLARARAEAVAALPVASVRAAVELARAPEHEAAAFLSLWGGPAHRAALGEGG
jgi:enoyl-CoA hydratase